MKHISIVSVDALNEHHRLSAAYLIMQSLPLYYEVDGIDESDIAIAVAESIGAKGTETESCFVALCENQSMGILTFLSAHSLDAARLSGAQSILKLLPRNRVRLFLNHLKQYDADYGRVPDDSIYVGRFAVDESYRGSGLAKRLFDTFLNSLVEHEGVNNTCSLHVDASNKRAISFYLKCGFKVIDPSLRYQTMVLA